MATVEDQVLELEHRFWKAAGDPQFYRDRFADDGVMAFHVGVMGKDEVVDAMFGAEEWASYTIDEPRFVMVSDDVVALVYTTRAVPAGGTGTYEAAITSVYTRRGDDWLLILHQQTPLA